MNDPRPWWQTSVVYQLYPRSFADGNGDGVGDLVGMAARLDHLAWLGVGAIWLSPIYPSPMRDFGYDVADYCAVDPTFGTLDDLDALVAAAHERGIKVILDWVPNHTSSDHPWFVESRSSRANPKRDWYVWADEPPNNWTSEFTGGAPAWTFDEHTGQYYLHCFLPEQPDLNWDNPSVREAMADVLRFWLDRGIDGFRCDVVHLIGKDLTVDDPPPEERGRHTHVPYNDVEVTHDRLRELRAVVDGYPGDRMLVGEVFLLEPARMVRYYGDGDELHLSFNFKAFFTEWTAASWRRTVDETRELLDPVGAWPTWVLSNHDFSRHRSRYGGSEARARAAAVLLLTLRGTPFLYQGEELALADAELPMDVLVDPGGRDKVRTPIPWTDEPPTFGWSGPAAPWLPFGADAATNNAARLRSDEASVLHLYRRLLALRNGSPALSGGTFRWLDGQPVDVLAFERADGDERWWVVVNLGDGAAEAALPEAATVVVAADGVGEGSAFTGSLPPDTAVLLRPTADRG